MYPFRTREPPSTVAKAEESPASEPKADARTRTGDPFITRERQVGDARPRKGTRGDVLAGNQAVSRPSEWTRVPARARADVPVLYPRCLVRQRAVGARPLTFVQPGASDASSKAPETALFVGKQQSRAALLLVVQARRATGRRARRSHCASERKPRPVPVWAPSKRARQARRGRSARRYPVRRGADDSGGGVSPTHRGRARSARRSRASRTFWFRSGPAGRLR